MISGMVWVDKRYLWLVNGCLEYHRPIRTNTCPPKPSQKSLYSKLVPILPRVSEVVACENSRFSTLLAAGDVSRGGTSAKSATEIPYSFFSLPTASRLSRVGWFSRALAFRSLYYPWGKMRTTRSLIGSLSNYDDDNNDDFKKTISLMTKTTALHVHHAF